MKCPFEEGVRIGAMVCDYGYCGYSDGVKECPTPIFNLCMSEDGSEVCRVMGKYNINADDFIKFLKAAGAKVTKAPEGEEGGFFINGERVDIVEVLRESFQTPIEVDPYEEG